MRPFKILGMLFILAMAISAFASTAAFALPEFLDHVPTTFTAVSAGAAQPELLDVATKLNIKCEKLLILLANGQLLTTTTMAVTIDFEQCATGGLAANSLGDKSDTTAPKLGLILVPVKGQTCFIGPAANKEAGIFFKIPPLHLEVPAVGELLEVVNNAAGEESSVVGLLTPNNALKTGPYILKTTGVKQECDGKKAAINLSVEHTASLLAEERAEATITFDEDEELLVV